MKYLQLFIGITIGVAATTVVNRITTPKGGTLRIDQSNPEKDLYSIEIDDLETLSKKRKIVLVIDDNAGLSQK